MNDQEVIMSIVPASNNLIAYEKATEAAGSAVKLVMRVPAPLKSIGDQVIRSASSCKDRRSLPSGIGRIPPCRQIWPRVTVDPEEIVCISGESPTPRQKRSTAIFACSLQPVR